MIQIEFNITFPKKINDIFYISQDKSEWVNKIKYIKKGSNPVPNRDKTLSGKELLIPKTKDIKNFFSKKSKFNYGIYILLFNDFKVYYVGIAARYSKLDKSKNLVDINPEGFLIRLRKHRAKCTGTYYNINHTKYWRDFAKNRYQFYKNRKVKDTMSDCELSLVFFKNHEKHKVNDKGLLEQLEDYINKNNISKILGAKYIKYSPIASTHTKVLSFAPKLNKTSFNALL